MKKKKKVLSFRKKLFFAAIAFFFLVIIIASFFGKRGMLEISRAKERKTELLEEIKQLEQKKKDLIREIQELIDNPEAVDPTAREKLLLMKPDEIMIIKEKEKPAKDLKKK